MVCWSHSWLIIWWTVIVWETGFILLSSVAYREWNRCTMLSLPNNVIVHGGIIFIVLVMRKTRVSCTFQNPSIPSLFSFHARFDKFHVATEKPESWWIRLCNGKQLFLLPYWIVGPSLSKWIVLRRSFSRVFRTCGDKKKLVLAIY